MASDELCKFSVLSLNSLRLKVRLGCTEEERSVPQFVRFDVKVRFASIPSGCFSDKLHETVCYVELSEQIRKICKQGEYQLIEKLGWTAYSSVKETLGSTSQLWLRVTKEKPPVPDLQEGTSFSLGDWNDCTGTRQ